MKRKVHPRRRGRAIQIDSSLEGDGNALHAVNANRHINTIQKVGGGGGGEDGGWNCLLLHACIVLIRSGREVLKHGYPTLSGTVAGALLLPRELES